MTERKRHERGQDQHAAAERRQYRERRRSARPQGGRRLTFAAAPVFAVMALLTAAHGGGPADILCSATHDASPLSGMTLMYALMAVFHAAPWVRLVSSRP